MQPTPSPTPSPHGTGESGTHHRADGTTLPPPQTPPEDCLECKVIGVSAMMGLAGYVEYHRRKIPAIQRVSHVFSATVSLGLLGIGVARALK
eukprot:m.37387 g.37387  ORF g.37387 m.37387 type:complete len:92 (-) comp5524_c0_seq2:2435-2710(-)